MGTQVKADADEGAVSLVQASRSQVIYALLSHTSPPKGSAGPNVYVHARRAVKDQCALARGRGARGTKEHMPFYMVFPVVAR